MLPSPPRPRPLTPYLGPTAHLSQSFLSHAFLALLLLAITLAILLAGIGDEVIAAKKIYTSGCAGVQSTADVMVSLPHYMADGVNELNARSVKAVMDGTADVLDLSLVAIEQIALFIIDTYRSLFLCLLDLVVHGSLTLLIDLTTEAESFVQGAFGDVRTELLAAIKGINQGLNSTLGVVDKIPGVNIQIPQITMPSLNSLSNVTIPSTLVSSLTNLNNSIPTLASLRTSLDSLISTPITLLRTSINDTLHSSSNQINIALLPVPATSNVDLCSGLQTGWIDDLGSELRKIVWIMLALVGVAMLLLAGVGVLLERWRYASYLQSIERARKAWFMDLSSRTNDPSALSTPSLLSFLSATTHPRLSLLVAHLSHFLNLSPHAIAELHWFGAYIFSPLACLFLLLGLSGLIFVQIQIWILNSPSVKGKLEKLAGEGVSGFVGLVEAKVNDVMNGTSVQWAGDTNRVIGSIQNGVNNDLFGWVNVTTSTLNNTINEFYSGITSAINSTFFGTPLDALALQLSYCLLGSKIASLSSALTFLQAHATISLPLVSPSALLLSPNRTTELLSNLGSGNSTGTGMGASDIVNSLVGRYEKTLAGQRVGFAVILGVWVLVLLMACVGVVWSRRGNREDEGESEGRKETSFRLKPLRSTSEKSSPLISRPVHLPQSPTPPPPFSSPSPSSIPPSHSGQPSRLIASFRNFNAPTVSLPPLPTLPKMTAFQGSGQGSKKGWVPLNGSSSPSRSLPFATNEYSHPYSSPSPYASAPAPKPSPPPIRTVHESDIGVAIDANPFADQQPTRPQQSRRERTQRDRDAEEDENPFRTPFDGAGEE